jgi:hypothetical protein
MELFLEALSRNRGPHNLTNLGLAFVPRYRAGLCSVVVGYDHAETLEERNAICGSTTFNKEGHRKAG